MHSKPWFVNSLGSAATHGKSEGSARSQLEVVRRSAGLYDVYHRNGERFRSRHSGTGDQTEDLESPRRLPSDRPSWPNNTMLDPDSCEQGEPTQIAVFDDLLTTGSHFKPMEITVRRGDGQTPVPGIFVARRYIVQEETEIIGL